MDSLPRESQPPTNAPLPEYAVSEIAGAIRRTLEGAFGRVRVRGEITELKRYPSGHIYLSLKDEAAKLESVVWKTRVAQLGLVPENGAEVIATGRISTYPDRSKYQLVIERMEYAGEGALLDGGKTSISAIVRPRSTLARPRDSTNVNHRNGRANRKVIASPAVTARNVIVSTKAMTARGMAVSV